MNKFLLSGFILGCIYIFPGALFSQQISNSQERKTPIKISPEYKSLIEPALKDSLIGLSIENFIELPTISEWISPKIYFPANPSYILKKAILRSVLHAADIQKKDELCNRAIKNVEAILIQSGAKKIKKVSFCLDPVESIYAFQQKRQAVKTAIIVAELNRLPEKKSDE